MSGHTFLWVEAYPRFYFQPAVNQGKQSIRECAGSDLLAAEFTEVWASKCWGCQLYKVVWHVLLSWGEGRVLGGGWGKENSYQPKRTAARARVLPSLTTHISSKCALDVAFSNPNKKPGEKMILWLVLFSIPWNICRHGDPSPDFFFQPCKMATCLFNRHVCIHVATYFLSRPSFLSFPFPRFLPSVPYFFRVFLL